MVLSPYYILLYLFRLVGVLYQAFIVCVALISLSLLDIISTPIWPGLTPLTGNEPSFTNQARATLVSCMLFSH
jgi:hypothetical protein